jgi:hypothetical protein
MKLDKQIAELEKKLQRTKEGFISLPVSTPPLAFSERSFIREEVIEYLQKGLDLFAEERRTRAAHEVALEEHRRAVPALKKFHAEAMGVVRKHFGADPKMLATFGAPQAAKAKPRSRRCGRNGGVEVVTTVIEEVITVCSEPGCGGGEARCGCSKGKPPKRVATPPCKEPKRRRPQRKC